MFYERGGAVKVRLMNPGDVGVLGEIFLAARVQAFGGFCEVGGMRAEDFGAATEGEVVWVAEDGGCGVVGFLSVWERERFVHHLYVAPAAQGRGVGTALLESLGSWLAPPYQLKCQVLNGRAMGFYARRGWVELGRGRDLMGEYALLEWAGRGQV